MAPPCPQASICVTPLILVARGPVVMWPFRGLWRAFVSRPLFWWFVFPWSLGPTVVSWPLRSPWRAFVSRPLFWCLVVQWSRGFSVGPGEHLCPSPYFAGSVAPWSRGPVAPSVPPGWHLFHAPYFVDSWSRDPSPSSYFFRCSQLFRVILQGVIL